MSKSESIVKAQIVILAAITAGLIAANVFFKIIYLDIAALITLALTLTLSYFMAAEPKPKEHKIQINRFKPEIKPDEEPSKYVEEIKKTIEETPSEIDDTVLLDPGEIGEFKP